MKNNDQFYFQGKYFDNENDFWQYIQEWKTINLDQETAERQIDTLKKEIVMNILLRGVVYSNIEFQEYINKIFMFAMNEMKSPYEKKE